VERLTDRIATQAEIIGVWSELIDSMESEIATLRALIADHETVLEHTVLGRDRALARAALAGDAPRCNYSHESVEVCMKCGWVSHALAGDAPKEQP
jgi:hypothetical protein